MTLSLQGDTGDSGNAEGAEEGTRRDDLFILAQLPRPVKTTTADFTGTNASQLAQPLTRFFGDILRFVGVSYV